MKLRAIVPFVLLLAACGAEPGSAPNDDATSLTDTIQTGDGGPDAIGLDDVELIDATPDSIEDVGRDIQTDMPEADIIVPDTIEPSAENCGDRTDNDGDGLEDCEDPDCCDELFCYEVDARCPWISRSASTSATTRPTTNPPVVMASPTAKTRTAASTSRHPV